MTGGVLDLEQDLCQILCKVEMTQLGTAKVRLPGRKGVLQRPSGTQVNYSSEQQELRRFENSINVG